MGASPEAEMYCLCLRIRHPEKECGPECKAVEDGGLCECETFPMACTCPDGDDSEMDRYGCTCGDPHQSNYSIGFDFPSFVITLQGLIAIITSLFILSDWQHYRQMVDTSQPFFGALDPLTLENVNTLARPVDLSDHHPDRPGRLDLPHHRCLSGMDRRG